MENDQTSNIAHLPSSSIAPQATPYQLFVGDIQSLPNRPLRLNIDCERFDFPSSTSKVDYLKLELELWAATVGKRPLHAFYISQPYRFFEAFELTRILHLIARRFRVSQSDTKCHMVMSSADEITPEHLALLRGLGFNAYQVMVPIEQIQDTRVISNKINLLRDYAISCIGVQLMHPDCLPEIRKAIKSLETQCQPDYICLGQSADDINIISSRGELMIEMSHNSEVDNLALGPESVSQLGDYTIETFCSPDKYKSALDVQRLPIIIKK